MKKTSKIIIATLFAAMVVLPLMGASDPTLIPIIRVPEHPDQNLNRGDVQQLFIAEYDDLLNRVDITCNEPCGNVYVTLISTAGDFFQTIFDTENGTLLIPVSGDDGYYEFSITTPDGINFIGEFTIE